MYTTILKSSFNISGKILCSSSMFSLVSFCPPLYAKNVTMKLITVTLANIQKGSYESKTNVVMFRLFCLIISFWKQVWCHYHILIFIGSVGSVESLWSHLLKTRRLFITWPNCSSTRRTELYVQDRWNILHF